ncbi:MAG: hypothetical protein ACPGLV_08320 [Bacteroidia bacterium]
MKILLSLALFFVSINFTFAQTSPIFYHQHYLAKSFNPAIHSFSFSNELMIAGALRPNAQTQDFLFSYSKALNKRFSLGAQFAFVNYGTFVQSPTYSLSSGYYLIHTDDFKLKTSVRFNYLNSRIRKEAIEAFDPNDPVISSLSNSNQLTSDIGVLLNYKKLSWGLGLQHAARSSVFAEGTPIRHSAPRQISSYISYEYGLSNILTIDLSHFFTSDFDFYLNTYQTSVAYRNLVEIGASFNNAFLAPFVSMHFQDNFKVYALYRQGFCAQAFGSTIEAGISFGFD